MFDQLRDKTRPSEERSGMLISLAVRTFAFATESLRQRLKKTGQIGEAHPSPTSLPCSNSQVPKSGSAAYLPPRLRSACRHSQRPFLLLFDCLVG